MEKLTKENIQFIEEYLIKNEVKYWDVRLEMLDHIVLAVEDKMNKSNINFDDALLFVHRDFGNRTEVYKSYNNKLIKHGLFADSGGFKELIIQKQKALGKKYRKRVGKELKLLCFSFEFLLEYVSFVGLFVLCYQFIPKYTSILGLLVLLVPSIVVVVHSVKYKFVKKSLSLTMVSQVGILCFTLFNLAIQISNLNLTKEWTRLIGIVMIAVFYVFLRAQLNVYFSVFRENEFLHKLKNN